MRCVFHLNEGCLLDPSGMGTYSPRPTRRKISGHSSPGIIPIAASSATEAPAVNPHGLTDG